ncbi:SDR family NAD(P)-dependent oxidoreductase [Gulosibacter sp. 10]|uniref:SDR family NAD(P)-dependent oxidoreductase n=1 Tax=Gulosibacter sp. 10 TaxID=1255570 RepID=UPI00097F59AA|nr:SDR family NAD(P)-dependent oxidoreductase [Gulosibacter sp. 10]SJM47929.1 oxidoreductase, short-chain dehydrogenase/reductase family [Gulosibacter sp. 10]
MSPTLHDRVVIITGAGSGIGRATALQTAAAGAHVVVAELDEAAANETVELIAEAGGSASASVGDISDGDVVAKLVDEAASRGRIGGLVNNAGVMDVFAGAGETDDATWERCLRVNLTAPFLLVRAVLPHLLEAGSGSIVNIASEAGIRGAAAGAAYTASKHGVVGLTRNTAYTYAKRGVRSNAVLPGGVETNIMSSIDQTKIDQAGMAAIGPVHQTALRNAKPDELAALIVFLLADESINVNGAIIPSDGGWSAG